MPSLVRQAHDEYRKLLEDSGSKHIEEVRD
jgi:hypothetical protein